MEEQEPSQQEVDDFNAGYLLKKYQPELLNGLLKSNDGKSEYLNTLAKGKQQDERRKIAEQQQQIKKRQKEKRPRR